MDRVIASFRERVCREIDLVPEGLDRYLVSTPFEFDDGDSLQIVLQRREGKWMLTDEGHTFMRLTYDIDEGDLNRGTRQRIIANALSPFGIEDRDGRLVLPVPDERFGDALFSFVQGILKIADVSYLSRERVVSTFQDDFREFLAGVVPEGKLAFDWCHQHHDPRGIYKADCRVETADRPMFVYGLHADGRTRDATISLLQYEKWGLPFTSLAVFENQQSIGRHVLARFTDVCDRQYSSLSGNTERIKRHLVGAVERNPEKHPD